MDASTLGVGTLSQPAEALQGNAQPVWVGRFRLGPHAKVAEEVGHQAILGTWKESGRRLGDEASPIGHRVKPEPVSRVLEDLIPVVAR
jgi:hypothetical protein